MKTKTYDRSIQDMTKGPHKDITPKWFEASDLPSLGPVWFYYKGEENLYFEYKNKLGHTLKGFIKY